jgi:hypothetical protein
MQTSSGVLYDGIAHSNCSVAVGNIWSYNQGVWLDGCTSLSVLTLDPQYSEFAAAMANRSFEYFGLDNSFHTMFERSCNASTGWCDFDNVAGRMFKGAFVRHLQYAVRDWRSNAPWQNLAAANNARDWILDQATSLVVHGTYTDNSIEFGQLWQGPYIQDNTPWVAHSVGFDLILAALDVA